MKSHDVNDHGATGQYDRQQKEPWVTPSLEVITLQSAEGGTKLSSSDGVGPHTTRTRS